MMVLKRSKVDGVERSTWKRKIKIPEISEIGARLTFIWHTKFCESYFNMTVLKYFLAELAFVIVVGASFPDWQSEMEWGKYVQFYFYFESSNCYLMIMMSLTYQKADKWEVAKGLGTNKKRPDNWQRIEKPQPIGKDLGAKKERSNKRRQIGRADSIGGGLIDFKWTWNYK